MDWEEMEREAMMEDRRKGRENASNGNTGRTKRPARNTRNVPAKRNRRR